MTDEYHGHKTMADGSMVPLSQDEAKQLWAHAEDQAAKRAEGMPSTIDALRGLISAHKRMQDLGWRLGGGLRVRKGDECAVAETGSTGLWRGRVDDDGAYVHYADSVSAPSKCWLKPLTDLTDEEREWMERCDKSEAEAYGAMLNRYANTEC